MVGFIVRMADLFCYVHFSFSFSFLLFCYYTKSFVSYYFINYCDHYHYDYFLCHYCDHLNGNDNHDASTVNGNINNNNDNHMNNNPEFTIPIFFSITTNSSIYIFFHLSSIYHHSPFFPPRHHRKTEAPRPQTYISCGTSGHPVPRREHRRRHHGRVPCKNFRRKTSVYGLARVPRLAQCHPRALSVVVGNVYVS